MDLDVVCATMCQKDFSKINSMNIQSNVIFANQYNYTDYSEMKFKNYTAKMITTQTVGVSHNRNIGLLYSDSDIILFSDDDVVYNDGYRDTIIKIFINNPDADAFIFNTDTYKNGKKVETETYNKTIKKVNFFNFMKYPTYKLAVKKNFIKKNNITFNTCFGGGNIYSHGEDTLFIRDLINNKAKIYTHPYIIGKTFKDTSSWFSGYNKKYFYDSGVLFAAISKKYKKLLCLQFLMRHSYTYKKSNLSFVEAYDIMKSGLRGYSKLEKYSDESRE